MTDLINGRFRRLDEVSSRMTIGKLFAGIRRWGARSRERRLLLELDDRMLRDIGLSRTDVLREQMKPFWRAAEERGGRSTLKQRGL
jgi:Domain of unknown function (DUF1127).